jgi:hypothetical protein
VDLNGPKSRVKEVLVALHVRSSGGRLGVNKTWTSSESGTTNYRPGARLKDGGDMVTPAQPGVSPEPRAEAHLSAPLQRMATDIAGEFPHTRPCSSIDGWGTMLQATSLWV